MGGFAFTQQMMHLGCDIKGLVFGMKEREGARWRDWERERQKEGNFFINRYLMGG